MILIVAEHTAGKLAKATLEMVTAARESGREGPITLLVLGQNVASVATEAAAVADQVLVADLPGLATYNAEVWAAATTQIAQEGEAHTVIIGGSRSGREYAPRVAVKLDAAYLEDATKLSSNGAALQAQRYTYLARVTETVEADGLVVVTVKPGSFAPAAPAAAAGEQYDVELSLPAARVEVTGKSVEKSSRVALTEADVIVTGGRGVGSPENFSRYVEALADNLGAGVGATRAVVDAGWRPYAEQVGQTGKTVQPKAYIALGVSGAVQHLSGMGKSKNIIAINKDAEAPIFKVADYGIVGDINEIVPALIEASRK
ncbi:electron transfer flavoprotein subunit alpha/FixB family protein [Deinococcus soli (ex Cha et al. 2016)]|jgi:electron transfer flavoprotein alpha subunit|uniref:Electron transfer flavoprotein alpha subunit n=2 Tax=Deinococcus soli (ex Cha et al. 2016) TaxID=1309411 RepID=A0AAE3XGY0_9DEIO|nr:electron transfer flavoprotein subunit alpha/FixB family protein [Deinococcus soli (ex Cha et al. 2016)]MDR6219493.1 electron transfer flavoprotein alpha subunit [Deinococcus soli (ex Cha et al. 2016)]MDR6327172.1 electron transfer flavoprotein alpha subunit [Deinococcus soli (ex Cha et al. 2016)]MDR6752362.1 electron transfer flavoprotein alpha subunit [Deinococcus soli (ex Cha et al. 2016)]